jgi:putative ABC transport system ATP-binding protein
MGSVEMDGRHWLGSQPPDKVPLIEINGLSKTYRRGNETIQVLEALSLTIRRGEFIALMGPSGSGKSTLLNLIGSIDTPSAGELRIAGDTVHQYSDAQRARWRARNVGFIFQLFHLHPALDAEHNIQLPLRLFRMHRSERHRRAQAALSLVGLSDRARHKPSQLSGGQQQRVAIARAIVTDPLLLLCDEPTGNLDRHASDEVLQLLKSLNTDYGKTILMVTHDSHAAAQAQRTLFLDKGRFSSEASS